MLLLPLAIALALPPTPASAEPLPLKRVMRHLIIGKEGGKDYTNPNWKPTSGTPMLAASEERCHDAFLELLDGFEAGKYKPGVDISVTELFAALRNQKSDRSRFLPYAERYALGDRGENKVGEYAQRNAVELLGQIGSDKHVEGLLKVMKDEDREVRRAALKAIEKLGDSRHTADVLNLNNHPVELHPISLDVERRLVSDTAEALSKKPIPESALKAGKPGDKK